MGRFLVIALALLIGLVSCAGVPTNSPTQMPQELIGKWDMFLISEDGGHTSEEVKIPFEVFNNRIFFVDNNTYNLMSQMYNTDRKVYEIVYSDGEKWIVKVSIHQGVKVMGVVVISSSGEDTGIRFAAKPKGSIDLDPQKDSYHPGLKLQTTNL
jgi:hypothetical protein